MDNITLFNIKAFLATLYILKQNKLDRYDLLEKLLKNEDTTIEDINLAIQTINNVDIAEIEGVINTLEMTEGLMESHENTKH